MQNSSNFFKQHIEQRAVFQQKVLKLKALHLPDVWTSFPVVLQVTTCANSAVCPEDSKKEKSQG
jgi:hypothetical protein